MKKLRLPIAIEHDVYQAKAARLQVAQAFNAELRQTYHGPTSCSRGCDHCCHHPVLLSLFEGISLFRWLHDQRMWTSSLKAKFEEVAARTMAITPEVWFLSMIPCPLLKDRECSAYEARPAMCRMTVSIGNPDDCHPHRVISGSGLVPRNDALQIMSDAEAAYLKKHRVSEMSIPLAQAVLYGEAILTGELPIEDIGRRLWQDLANL